MIKLIKKIFGIGPKVDYAAMVKNGAVIIDVRSKGEYNGGHIKGSLNIPLDHLTAQLDKINKNKPIITCCQSGMRSAAGKNILKSKGFNEVFNGGGWAGLQRKLQ